MAFALPPAGTPASPLATPQPRPLAPFALPAAGEVIDQFRIIQLLGRGGMGAVLLARDERLGRTVALKLTRPDRLDADRAAAMWAEGRITALLSHPNIVTIHAIGRWGNVPYLALEYVPGETLRERLNATSPGPLEILRIGATVARALQAAHEAGVVHCDLKPENILLPPDGRLRVVDFGIASAAVDAKPRSPAGPALVVGTPEYMAPERFEGKPIAPPVDLWSLGILLYELATGQRPHDPPRDMASAATLSARITPDAHEVSAQTAVGSAGDSGPLDDAGLAASRRRTIEARVADPAWRLPEHPRMDPALHALVASLLLRDPWQRPGAAEVADRLTRMLERGDHADRDAVPFRGLAAFEERHCAHFFGRDAEIDALVERMRRSSVVPVVGPSGVGKSSLVQAGLIPRLREARPLHLVSLRPGERPLLALAARLVELDSSAVTAGARSQAEVLADRIRQEPGHANVILHGLAARHGQVLLFVDQLEEVVTLGTPRAEADAFLQAVLGAADPIDPLVRVVFTLRDDQLVHVGGGDAMRAALSHIEIVRRPGPLALRDAVLRPLQRQNYRFDDPAVVDRMVADVGDHPAALPLLQFACAQLWQRRDDTAGLLRAADYAAIGGVVGALASHAEAQLAGLDAADLDAARHLLLRLVTPAGTRQVVAREQALAGLGLPGARIAERLLNARLLHNRRSTGGGVWQLELAHESLVQLWPQLARWIEESSDERSAVAEVTQAAQVWRSRGSKGDGLWALDSVLDFRRRLRGVRQPIGDDAQAFLAASEHAGRRGQRIRRNVIIAAIAAMAIVTIATIETTRAFRDRTLREMEHQRQIHLAAADMGLVHLRLGLWQRRADGQPAAVAVGAGQLQWTLHDDDPAEGGKPGLERVPDSVRRLQRLYAGESVQETLETRSGPAWLRVGARGPAADRPCDDVWIRIAQLPGYRDRAYGPRDIAVSVPTCAESARDMAEVPGGPFRFAIAAADGATEATAREVTRTLPTYEIDVFEVSNAQFRQFARMAAVTGVDMPQYPPTPTSGDLGAPDRPVTVVTWHQANVYCRAEGKRLPTEEEWVKAGRGGLYLDAAGRVANPRPERRFPWGDASDGRAHIDREDGPLRGSSAVDASPADVSPHGVRNLAGNVAEWTSTWVAGHPALAIVRGGNWSAPEQLGLHRLDQPNMRYRSIPNLATGFRCARGAP
ncbi:MAG: SUMF1/EgtB/PvdO family nonheme iron enzyme [Deltaproteobacteria bacterium]|nr:SUMF1/EgtB/PvdO family nonheme iron enzyme [Deltaproteobacteria bacterium]